MASALKALDSGEGEALWAAGSLMVVKATGEDTWGGLTVIEQECPPGLISPAHQHEEEEQCIYMLAGSIDLTCGEDQRVLGPGGLRRAAQRCSACVRGGRWRSPPFEPHDTGWIREVRPSHRRSR